MPMMSRRRIAILQTTAQLGGAERSLVELLRRLDGNPEVTVILPEDGPLAAAARSAGAAATILPWPARVLRIGERAARSGLPALGGAAFDVRSIVRRLRRLLADNDFDALVTNGIKAHLLGAAARPAMPLVWYLRDGLEGRRVSSALLKWYGRRPVGAIAISRYLAGESSRVLPSRTRVEVIGNIIDTDRFSPVTATAADLIARKARGEVWFGVVGALTPLKGQDLFLEAAGRVCEALPYARFVIVGDNHYRSETSLRFGDRLRALAHDRGVAAHVRFLGHREDMPGVLQALDVLVQPNRGPEGLGRSVLEAMACAKPVIAVKRWGPAELVDDGVTGLLVPWMNIEALAAAMIRLGRDPELRDRMGAQAPSRVRTLCDPQRIVGQFRAFLEEMSMSRSASLSWSPRLQ